MAFAFASVKKSTTGRSSKAGFPRALRAGIGVLDALAPALAERVAERLFMTPPRHPQPPWESAALAGGEPFAVRAGGTIVRGHRMGCGPGVLLVHGWGGRGGQLAAFAPPLVEAGCSAIVFDGPGHGASGGRTTNLARLADAIAALARRFGVRAAVGHSFGGAALALALHRGVHLEAAVLIGAPKTPRLFLDPFCAALGLGEATREAVRRRIERNVGIPMDDLELSKLAASLAPPALVVHDRADAEVPFEHGAAIAASWPRARLLATEGLGHRRLLRDARVVAEVSEFVLSALRRCGCGRVAVAIADGESRCETCLLSIHLSHRAERQPRQGFDEAVTRVVRGIEVGLGP